MAKDPNAVANKWATNLSASGESIRAGVMAVAEAPGAAAARAVDLWAQRTMAAKDKWKSRVGAVPKEEWQRKMIDVGLQRISGGATANKPKMVSFMTEFLPFQETVTNATRAMPKGTIDQSIARMINQVQGTAKFKRSGQ